jgi:thymidylate synthase ThyX
VTYSARILADSIAPSGKRLTTFEVTFPRIVLSEFNTHRAFSRNSASSRAIPIEKMIERVQSNPFVPSYWGANQKGMQAHEEISDEARERALVIWDRACVDALFYAQLLSRHGVHKQLANRLIEPFMWQTVIVSATEFENFFRLRCHPDAQPEIRTIAVMMRDLYESNTPTEVAPGESHLPLVEDRELLEVAGFAMEQIKQISVGRCARVSYLTHDGKRDPQADLDLCARLKASGHMSPFEHVARSRRSNVSSRNFSGWTQYREEVETRG